MLLAMPNLIMLVPVKIMPLFLNVCLKIKTQNQLKKQIKSLLIIRHHIFFILSYTLALISKTQLTTAPHSRLKAVT